MEATGTPEAELDAYRADEERRAADKGFDEVKPAPDRVFVLPAGWQGSELQVSQPDPLGDRPRFRVVAAVRADAAGVIRLSVYAPETVARAAPEFFTQLLGSVQ